MPIFFIQIRSSMMLFIILIGVSCGYQDRKIDETDQTSESTSVTITRSNGSSETLEFKTPLELDDIGPNPLAFQVVDLNDDEREDIVLLNNVTSTEKRAIRILIRSSKNNSSDPTDLYTVTDTIITEEGRPQYLIVEDVNDDDIKDVIVSHPSENLLSFRKGKLSGDDYSLSTSPKTIKVGSFPTFLATGEFKGEGIVGIAVANLNSRKISIVTKFTSNKFTVLQKSVLKKTIQVVTGDWNNDGCPDIASVNSSQERVLLFKKTGCDGSSSQSVGFRRIGTIEVEKSPQAIISGDWNDDGNADLAVSNERSNSISLLYGTGKGTFTRTNIDVGGGPEQVAATDFNKDGVMDFVIGNTHDDDLTILLSNGSGSRQSNSKTIYERGDIVTGTIPTGSRPSYIKISDVNFDGKDDILLTLPFEGKLSILLQK